MNVGDEIPIGEAPKQVNFDVLPDIPKTYDYTPQMPEFNGNLKKWIVDNTLFPRDVIESGEGGKVYVTFIVEKDGTVSNPEIAKGVGGSCDKEALRVIGLMPKWKPGELRGKPVRVRLNIPIKFEIRS